MTLAPTTPALARCIKCGQRQDAPTERPHPTTAGAVRWKCGGCGWERWAMLPVPDAGPVLTKLEVQRATKRPAPVAVAAPPPAPAPAKPHPCHQMVYRKPEPSARPTITSIAETARALLQVDADTFYSPSRHPLAVLARMLSVVVARRTTIIPYKKLALEMGKGGHSTWICSIKRFDELNDITTAEYVRKLGPNCKDRSACIPAGLADARLSELAAAVEAEVMAKVEAACKEREVAS